MGCQARAIAEQPETALAKYKDAKVDMWVWCAGAPKVQNGAPKQMMPGPPYGISYTQWQLFDGYSIAWCAPNLPLMVHEVNHRYLENLEAIEGVHLTQFHGLTAMGSAANDITPNNLLSLASESWAVMHTAGANWLIVRPEVADVYVATLSQRGKGAELEVAGWLNEGICPLLVLRAPPDLPVPAKEIGYFR